MKYAHQYFVAKLA